ncbi:MAG: type II toxin-antitoxin system HicA family toxin [Oscillospiraceae bacterium]|nr:type II toxin-antitoxin system HicA family toxin [Oscillospiraceae bacterium]MDY6208006.1 type II toxin-antitoxin system HicA family toxin [Oscillospiraceae bacterium]
MRKKEFATREAVAILAANGFSFLRPGKGGHSIYSNGKSSISIPVHSKTVNKMLFARIIKENGLRV